MSGLKFYIIDSETNGLSKAFHEIIQLSIIRTDDRKQLSRDIKCLYPERSSIDALKVTGKTLLDLEKGHSREEVVETCNKFFNEDGLTPAHRCIVGHNIFTFDKKFLFALWESVGQQFPADLWLDTLPMTRAYAKSTGIIKPKVNLQAACDLLGIKKISKAHNAIMDSRNNYLLWQNLVEDKKMDYLQFIKTAQHIISESEQEEIDMSIFDD